MATVTDTEKPNAKTSMPENPNKTLDPTFPPTVNSEPDPSQRLTEPPPLQAPASDTTPGTDKVAGDSKGTAATTASAEAGHDAPLSDVQKKIRRAERFGISVQLSEEEKRNSRAERFGTGSALQSSEAPKSEQLKRKARAERFGMPSPSTASDEDAKKKARLARFASVSKTDPVEEDKRKARALRFSNPSSSSLSQVNGKGNIEPNAAIVGKSGGGT